MTIEQARSDLQQVINLWNVKNKANPALIIKKLQDVYDSLEDVYSVESETELNTLISTIGDDAGTIFFSAGTHAISTGITINTGASLVIHGYGDNTILQVADAITCFNVTDCASLTLKNLKIDCSNYTGNTCLGNDSNYNDSGTNTYDNIGGTQLNNVA